MQNNGFRISYYIIIILVSVLAFGLGFTKYNDREPNNVYNIYVDGEVVGTVDDKEDFESYINRKEASVMKKYGVDKVYMPNGVSIKRVVTYGNNIDSNDYIYKKMVKLKQFTIKGVIITISSKEEGDGYETRNLYVTSKEVFDKALISLIKSFVNEKDYESYMSSTQKEIVDTGSIIKSIDLNQKITYKKGYISIDKEIFNDSSELAKYLLFGTTEKQASYVVREGDTVESVAVANKLNVQEFLLANSGFNSKNILLYSGQVVNVGLINPVLDIAVEVNGVKDEEKNFGVVIKYDESRLRGTEYIETPGEKGLYRVNREYLYINGQLTSTQTLSSSELKPTVDQVIVKGDKEVPHIADLTYWAWPTDTPYTITTYYGYRWGTMHAAIDIYGPGYGSAIYAANNGTVIAATGGCTPCYLGCNGRRGNYIIINHNIGGYHSTYMHLATILVKPGQVVARGQKIGTMGNSGEVYPVPTSYNPYGGTHLHFATSRGDPSRGGLSGNPFDPLSLY